jgi:hypothetical protein
MRWNFVALLCLLLFPFGLSAQTPIKRCVDSFQGNLTFQIRDNRTIVREPDGILLGSWQPFTDFDGSPRYQLPSVNLQYMYFIDLRTNTLLVRDLMNGHTQHTGQCQDISVEPPRVDPRNVLGVCRDNFRNYEITLLKNFTGFRSDQPAILAPIWRDATGQFFLRLPSKTPEQNAFFAGWDGRLYELSASMDRGGPIGACQYADDVVRTPPQAPLLPDFTFDDGRMIVSGGLRIRVPDNVYGETFGISPPMIATEQQANICLEKSGLDAAQFVDCLAPSMMSPNQKQAYDCVREGGDELTTTTCLAGIFMGEKEKSALRDVEACYREVGGDWEQHAFCMAGKRGDERTVKAFQCVKAQAESADLSAVGVAICLAAGELKLNPELTIAVECAATSGGEPLVFAGCAGGRLTERELRKCLDNGIGGDGGCFGPNNEIVRGLQQLGVDMAQVLNPNGLAIQTFNTAIRDIANGPGPNNDIVRAIDTVNNDLKNGPGPNNDVVRFFDGVGESLGVKLPKLPKL